MGKDEHIILKLQNEFLNYLFMCLMILFSEYYRGGVIYFTLDAIGKTMEYDHY